VKLDWRDGNQLLLLENGESFFPAAFEAMAAARSELLIETFILFDDEVGRQLQAAVIAAARRGVQVDLTVDGYGSPDLSPAFIGAMTQAGVRFHIFDPRPRIFGLRTGLLHRLHRKIIAIDGECAFIGGINYAVDQLAESSPYAKQDYAVRIIGPLAQDIQRYVREALAPTRGGLAWRRWRRGAPAAAGQGHGARAAFVTRDNHRHRDDIERCYRTAIRTAREEVLIANAYFFPGFRLLREMRRAARRGVKVQLILQGEPDMGYVRTVARLLYGSLLKDGVAIHEFTRRPLHGKVAVVDGAWSTVGSSNLDPLSLSLNLEANVLIHDRDFALALRARLLDLVAHHCRAIQPEHLPQRTMWRYLVHAIAYHTARHFPSWLSWLPRGQPSIHSFDHRGEVHAAPVAIDGPHVAQERHG